MRRRFSLQMISSPSPAPPVLATSVQTDMLKGHSLPDCPKCGKQPQVVAMRHHKTNNARPAHSWTGTSIVITGPTEVTTEFDCECEPCGLRITCKMHGEDGGVHGPEITAVVGHW